MNRILTADVILTLTRDQALELFSELSCPYPRVLTSGTVDVLLQQLEKQVVSL